MTTFIDKPWGKEEIWARNNYYIGKILYIKEGQKLSYQYHNAKKESIRVLKGKLNLEIETLGGTKNVLLTIGETFYIPNKVAHRMEAITDCEIIEVSTPEIDDVVRLKDEYGRVEKES